MFFLKTYNGESNAEQHLKEVSSNAWSFFFEKNFQKKKQKIKKSSKRRTTKKERHRFELHELQEEFQTRARELRKLLIILCFNFSTPGFLFYYMYNFFHEFFIFCCSFYVLFSIITFCTYFIPHCTNTFISTYGLRKETIILNSLPLYLVVVGIRTLLVRTWILTQIPCSDEKWLNENQTFISISLD